MKKIFIVSFLLIGIETYTLSQIGTPPASAGTAVVKADAAWYRGGNFPVNSTPAGANILGTRWPSDIWIMTNNSNIAKFTHGNFLTSLTGNSGDGLRIFDPMTATGGIGHLDLFTSGGTAGGNETHIVWGSSGQISGQNNRFEFLAKAADGFWFNLVNSDKFYKFATGGTVHAFVGSNRSWRIGNQSEGANISAIRKLEVVDVIPQFRLHYGALNSTSGPFTDFLSNNVGNLQILPSGGKVGINLPGNPTANLDVNGDVRIRNVAAAAPNSLLIGVDAGSASDVNVRRLDFPGVPNQVLLGNGTWGPIPNTGLGVSCSDPNLLAGAMLSDNRVNLNNNNLYFFNIAGITGKNRIGIGYTCGMPLSAKLNVSQKEFGPTPTNTSSGYFMNTDVATFPLQTFTGIQALAIGVQTVDRVKLIGGQFQAYNSRNNTGVYGSAESGTWVSFSMPATNIGGDFRALKASSIGVRASASGTLNSSGVVGYANGSPYNFGGTFTSDVVGAGISYGVYGSGGPSGTPANQIRAGYFAGIVEGTMMPVWGSDQQFKTNVSDLTGTLKILSQLKPHQYYFDTDNYERFNFGTGLQFGFIAQEIEQYYPNLVFNSTLPPQYDSLGNITDSAVIYKSLNYTGLIPVNTAAIIELNKKVEIATLSDQTIKTDVQNLTGCLDKVLDMRGVSYDWNHTIHPELNLDSANHLGFIAQEIAQIDPRLTYLADDSLLHVEYDKVVPILAEAIQELNGEVESKDSIINVLVTENDAQQHTIDDLNNRLSQLENCLSGILPFLCQLSQTAIQANTPATQEEVRKNLNVTLSNRNTIVLDQNIPNPFAEQTSINFSIPETVKKAQIHFYDGNGRFMNAVEVMERGPGSITVFGSDLSSGVYTYTLVADGQVVATKKMMKH